MTWPALSGRRWDRLLGLGLLALLGVELLLTPEAAPEVVAEWFAVGAAAALAIGAGVRRRAPVVLVVLAAVVLVASTEGPFDGPVAPLLAIAVATYSAGAETRRRGSWAGAAGVAVVIGLAIARDLGPDQQASDWALPVLLFGGPWLVGLMVRIRGEREAALERARAEESKALIRTERARIARELHDVVAHAIGVVLLQARGARRSLDADPAAARGALDAIEATSAEALGEMRRLVRVLREDLDGGGSAPTPGVRDLGTLVKRVRQAGLPVDLTIDGPTDGLPPGVDLAAYRVVQEALTNALVHAGRAVATVVVRRLADAVEVEVVDTGIVVTRSDRDGHGLIGMRERVAAARGTLDAGPRPDGGFGIRARIPLEVVAP